MSSEKKIEHTEAINKHLMETIELNRGALVTIDKLIENLSTTQKKHAIELKQISEKLEDVHRKLVRFTNSSRHVDLEQKLQGKYEELHGKVNNYIKRIHHIESAQQEQGTQTWANVDAIERVFNDQFAKYYSKAQLDKRLIELEDKLKLGLIEAKKVRLEESLAELKADLREEISEQNILRAQTYDDLSEALEFHTGKYQNDLAELRNDIKDTYQFRQLLEEFQKENVRWQEEQQKTTEEAQQRMEETGAEVNRALKDAEFRLKTKSDLIDKLNLTVEILGEQLSDLQKDRSNNSEKQVQEESDKEATELSLTSDSVMLDIKSLIKEELEKAKASWLKEIRDQIDVSQNIDDEVSSTTRELLKEEIERYLSKGTASNKSSGISREDLDAAIKLLLSQIDAVRQDFEARIKDFGEQLQWFDINFDNLSNRLKTLNKKIDDIDGITSAKTITTTSVVRSKEDPPPKTKEKHWEYLTYFTPQPNIDDVFIQAKVSTSFKPGKTIYQIKLANLEAMEGELHLVSDTKTLQMAHNAPDTYLTACEFQAIDIHQLNPSSTRPGKVAWNGKNWKLVERITVR